MNLEQKPCNGSSLYHRGEPEQENFCLELQICILKHLFLDITIHSKSKYTIHWFDDVYTKVILRNTGGNITHA